MTLDDIVRATSAARRAVRDLGLDRKREPAGLTLQQYLATRADTVEPADEQDVEPDEEMAGPQGLAGELGNGSDAASQEDA